MKDVLDIFPNMVAVVDKKYNNSSADVDPSFDYRLIKFYYAIMGNHYEK